MYGRISSSRTRHGPATARHSIVLIALGTSAPLAQGTWPSVMATSVVVVRGQHDTVVPVAVAARCMDGCRFTRRMQRRRTVLSEVRGEVHREAHVLEQHVPYRMEAVN